MQREHSDEFDRWNARQELAEAMIPLIGGLYRNHGVVTSIHGRRLINKSPVEVLKAHRFARQLNESELPIEETMPIMVALSAMPLNSASIDLAKLVNRFRQVGGDLGEFLAAELAPVLKNGTEPKAAGADVVLYGFGRIGRLLARILIAHAGNGEGLRLRAVVVRRGSDNDLVKRASLLRRDSVHGPFEGTISVDTEANTILANGTLIQVIYSNDPATIDYTEYGISDAIVVDNTGRWRDREGLSQHLKSKGVKRVLLTAPGKGDLKNIVYGLNHDTIEDTDTILSAASCTTNAISPVLKVISDEYGIEHGHVETVHSYTNDQNLTDNFHSGDRRGRSAPMNMVITETGAAKAVAKAVPELAGLLTGSAIRVPTPNVSMAILNLNLATETTREEVNRYLRKLSLDSTLRQQIDFIDSPEVVSSDFTGSHRAGIVDGLATISSGKHLVLYVWYDNEFGYTSQVVRVIEHMGHTHPQVIPERAVVGA
ncbi:glyceraldehyde-3-phosphate dehydrogenase [Salinibacterium sp. SWN139]|uniref:glyceraldehyde-3-phosphate dehydrogenase n=1 Tax=Salinibacterium sp. SWN139 TaxID=2792055 RepID=UPI0018CC8ABD|nr:glyceraldehyde-3-phosphate dehydrogenase [Salinibacterium sp. SWN139]MBH0052563.1 glyceraldehyde-3-phosphate dehydrogenase [Salinibacterium sp. SWN139]